MKHEATRNKPRLCQPGEDSDNIKLDREFQNLIPPLSARELTDLHRSLDDEQGCRDALIIWKGHDTLVDGHNRIRYCRERNYAFPVIEMEFSDREAVKAHILSTQLGRRNLAPAAESYLRGKRYQETKKQGARRDKTSGHTDQKTTAERLGEEFKVSEKTIRRDARLAQAVDQVVENCGPDSRNLLLCREVGLTQADVLRVAKLKPAEQRQYLHYLREHGKWLRKPRKASREQKPHRPETADERSPGNGRRTFRFLSKVALSNQAPYRRT